MLGAFRKAKKGRLVIALPDGRSEGFGSTISDHEIHLNIFQNSVFKDIILKNDIGLGESYFDGQWDTNDLTGLIRWLIANKGYFGSNAENVFAQAAKRILLGIERIKHFTNRNSNAGSRRNIAAHYDLGNEFYAAFLDSSMTYSSAYFANQQMGLHEAQIEKYDRLCHKLDLSEDNHLLEVGCGWGGFSTHVATEYGCRVTATTISRRQYEFAKQRIAKEGLEDRIELLLTDYRDLEGKYDRIASIEMIEAVGHAYLGAYFKQFDRLATEDCLIAIQGITCPTSHYAGYTQRVDFIRKHVFPGAHLPSLSHLIESASENGSFEMMHQESFGLHYAKTLEMWQKRFNQNWPSIKKLGFDESFRRKWNFYLSYCEAGFLERHVNVSQIVFSKPDVTTYRYEQASQSHSYRSTEESKPSLAAASF